MHYYPNTHDRQPHAQFDIDPEYRYPPRLRRYRCPTCKTPNALSAREQALGYQCRHCAEREEGAC